MAGVNENLEERVVAEAIRTALLPLFPGKELVVRYIPRDDILGYDEHRIVARKWRWLPFGGKIIARYFGGPYASCHVFDEEVQKLMVKEGFFTPELQQAV